MGTTEESSKPSDLYDPSSSPTRPLLSQPHPPPSIEEQSPYPTDPTSDSDQTQFLHICYNHGPRPLKDLAFLLLFSLLALCTFGFGIFSIAHKNDDYSNVSSYSYNSSSSSCVRNSSLSVALNHGSSFSFCGMSNFGSCFSGLFFLENNSSFLSSSSDFLRGLIWTLVITFILSVPIVWSVLLLLKHFTKQIVYVSIPFFVLIPIGVNVYWFVACAVSSSCSNAFPLAYRIFLLLFIFLIIVGVVWIFVLNFHRIELTIKIIGVASDALSRNLGFFGILPCLTLGLLVYYVPIVLFLVFARFNGKIVPHESNEEYSCVWKQDSWVPAYYALAIVTMLWSAAAMVEMMAYVISGTVAQWYFSKDDSSPRRKIRSSLRNAFGPSFGTVCFSGLLICVVRLVRAAFDCAREEDACGIVNVLLRCCVHTFLSAVDFLNKFTINFAAITGEGYCTSARMTYELLRRNLLSAVFVETISTRLLAGIIFVISAIYAVVVCAILSGASDLGAYIYLVAVSSWVLLMLVLGFFVHMLDNVIDTIYVCYAIDRDKGDISKPDVHEVYVHLPIIRSQRSYPVSKTPITV